MADGITASIFGNIAVLANLDKYSIEIQTRAQLKLEEAGQMALDGANSLTPVLTGYLKSRNQLQTRKGVATVSNDVNYALYVVMGHRTKSGTHVPPNDFLTPPWYAAGNWLRDNLVGII